MSVLNGARYKTEVVELGGFYLKFEFWERGKSKFGLKNFQNLFWRVAAGDVTEMEELGGVVGGIAQELIPNRCRTDSEVRGGEIAGEVQLWGVVPTVGKEGNIHF